jgi:RNA polymerase sigma-70 factor (ECF subfamily)
MCYQHNFHFFTACCLHLPSVTTTIRIKEFITALKKGDQAAFRQLVEEYQQKVQNTAIGLVQDEGLAEDIAQEVFVTIYKSILSFNEQSSLSTWVYRITVNKCLDHIRSKGRQKRQGFLSQLFHKGTGEVVHEQPDFVHPGVVLERREQSKYLFKAIDSLAENQKTAFVLTHIEDLPQKEVAEIMNISVKAVESLLQRAKANLRKTLNASGG